MLNSILDGTKEETVFYSAEFPRTNQEFSINTMADRKISVTYYRQDPDSMAIDGICPVSKKNRDIETINGFIHQVGYVINPSNETLGSTLHKYTIDYTSNLTVMSKLVEICGLIDTLTRVRDERYERLYRTGAFPAFNWQLRSWPIPPPEHRKYGFTFFAETDEFWEKELGKDRRDITKEDVMDWLEEQEFYPEAVRDGNYTNENNLLNLFVTYHLLPQRIPVDKLALHYNEKGFTSASSAKAVPVPSGSVFHPAKT